MAICGAENKNKNETRPCQINSSLVSGMKRERNNDNNNELVSQIKKCKHHGGDFYVSKSKMIARSVQQPTTTTNNNMFQMQQNDYTRLQTDLEKLCIMEATEPQRKVAKRETCDLLVAGPLSVFSAQSPIRQKVTFRCQFIKEAVLHVGGTCTFGELVQYIRACNRKDANKSTFYILHALKLALHKEIVFMFDQKIVTKEGRKNMEKKKKEKEVSISIRRKLASSAKMKRHRFSYRILKNQI